MTMRHSRCHWSHALYQVLVSMLMQKIPLFVSVSNLYIVLLVI